MDARQFETSNPSSESKDASKVAVESDAGVEADRLIEMANLG